MPDLRLPAYTEAINMSSTPIPAADVEYVPDENIPMPAPEDVVYLYGSNEPAEITVAQLTAAFEALGLGSDIGGITSVTFTPHAVTVVRLRRDARPAGGVTSTITTTIGIRYA